MEASQRCHGEGLGSCRMLSITHIPDAYEYSWLACWEVFPLLGRSLGTAMLDHDTIY